MVSDGVQPPGADPRDSAQALPNWGVLAAKTTGALHDRIPAFPNGRTGGPVRAGHAITVTETRPDQYLTPGELTPFNM